MTFDLIAHLRRQQEFSSNTFGPGTRAEGLVDHIAKELDEIRAKPGDLMEWVDVILLALDGAWRAGFTPEEIAIAIDTKQSRNELRAWPDWRTAEPGKAIEHVRAEPRLGRGKALVTLTIAEIIDLAEFSGVEIDFTTTPKDEELDTELTIEECPPAGLLEHDEDETGPRYAHVAHFTEYPEEGSVGLGPEIKPP